MINSINRFEVKLIKESKNEFTYFSSRINTPDAQSLTELTALIVFHINKMKFTAVWILALLAAMAIAKPRRHEPKALNYNEQHYIWTGT